MATKWVEVNFGNGVNLDAHPLLLPEGFCQDARHMRFEDNMAHKMKGYSVYFDTAAPADILGLHVYKPSTTTYIMRGTAAQLGEIHSNAFTALKADCTGTATESGETMASMWSFADFGNHLFLSNGVDAIQRFSSPYTALATVTADAALPSTAQTVLAFQRHLVVLGESASPFEVTWSDIDDYTTWTPAAVNDAGSMILYDSKTPVVGGKTMGDYMVVFTKNQIHVFQYIGGTYVFQRRVADWNVGLWRKTLLAGIEEALFFMSMENFHMFDGARQKPIGDGIRKDIWDLLTTTAMSRGFAYTVVARNEVHFCVPTSAAVYPNLDCIYNYRNDSWSFDSISVTAGCNSMPYAYPLIALQADDKIYAADYTSNRAGAAVEGYVTSKEFGADSIDRKKTILAVYPILETESSFATTAHLHCKVGFRDNSCNAVSWGSELDLHAKATSTVEYKFDTRAQGSGRFWQIKIYTDEATTQFSLAKALVLVDEVGGH